MATWHELTRDPEYQALSQKAKALVKQGFFQQQIANDPEYQSFSPETQKAIADDFWNTPDDTGQGYVSSMLGSAGRGFGEIVPGTVTGVGALLGSEGIQGAGESLREGLEYIAPVNPIYQDDLAMKGMNVLGTVGSIMATGGIGGAAGRGLAAEGIAAAGTQAAKQALARQAIQRGASSALYGTGFAQGAAQKAEENKRLGMEGPEAYLNLIGGGLSEVLPEMLPFGTALETAAARRMLGGVDEAGKVIPGIRMSAAQEALEGGTTQSLSNLSTQLTAPEGVETPGLFEGFGEAALWEGVGGSMFGAINKLGRTPLDKQTEAQNRIATEAGAIPTNAVPEQTNEQKLAAMQAGGTTVVDPDGKTAVLVEPPKVAPSDPGMAAARDLVTPTANVEGAQANAELAKKQIDESDELAKTAVAAIASMPPPPAEPAVQPEQEAKAVEPEVTPSLETEMPKKPSQTITGSNGGIAPAMPVQPQAGEAMAFPPAPSLQEGGSILERAIINNPPSVSPLIQPATPQENAPLEIPDGESLLQKPQDRIESREAEETGAGDQLLRPAEGEEEVVQPPVAAAPTEAPQPFPNLAALIAEYEARRKKESVKKADLVPQPSPNLPALIAVRDNNATPEQVQSLVDQGLVEQVDGQNIITEAGVAAMPEGEKPRLTPAERAAEVEGTAAPGGSAEAIANQPKKGDLVTVALGGREYPKTRILNVRNTPEGVRYQVDVFGPKFVAESSIIAVEKPIIKTAPKVAATPQLIRQLGDIAVKNKQPLDQGYIDSIGGNIPQGYVKQGDLYVFQPQTKQAAEKQTPAPSRKGAGAAGVTERQPSGGSIPEVAPSETQETQPSTKENDAIAKEEEAALERQRKMDERTKTSLNSIIDPEKTNIVQGTVSAADAESARRALNNSGEIPNAFLTRIYASPEAFLADRANQRYFPSSYARLQSEGNIEGLFERGQTLIFADKIGVSDLDRRIGKNLGISPEQAAARRVIAHENGHRSVALFTAKEKQEFLGYLRRKYNDAQIDNLVRVYSEYADWRTNPESRNEALEELFLKDFERLEKIPTGGIWDDIIQFLKRVWRRLTGRTDDPTLDNMKDVVRLLRNAMRRSAVPSFTTKDGGEVRLSLSDRFNGITPEQDAEYLSAVEAGDMEKAQRMVDEAAKAAIKSNPRNAVKLGRFLSKSEYESVREQIEELPREVFYVGNVEVIRNPTGDDIRGMTNEERSARGGRRSVDPDTRFTKDNYGNTWRWKATGGMHSMIEPSISRREGVEVNQNNGIPYHSDLVKDAIRSGEYIPSSTLSEYSNYADFVKPSSADPVTRDESGNVIPLSQRFQAASPDIRFSRVEYENKPSLVINPRASSSYSGRGVASIPTSDNSARAQAIREGVSRANWDELSTTQRAKALEEFGLKSISSRYSFDAAILPVRLTNERTDENRPASVYAAEPSPAIAIQFDASGLSNLLSGDAVTAFAAIYDIAQEEVIHTAQHLNAYAKWQDSGVMLPFEEFEVNYYTSMLREMVQAAGAGLSGGDARVANIIVSAWNLYNPNIPSNDVNQIIGNLVQTKTAPAFTMEIGRQLLQFKRQDFTTETGWMRFVEAMKWYLADAVEALKTSLSLVRSGQAGEMIRREIQDVESILNRLETNPDSILPDAKPSRVEYASDYSSASSAGAQLARDTVYDDRIIEMRDAIRRAYEQSSTEAGVAMPIDELYAKAKELAPEMTENEFGSILQDLYEDNGAVLQEGESAFDVFTPEGRRAGFAVIMPKRAVASRVETEGEAVKNFQEGIEAIESNSLNAFSKARPMEGADPEIHTVQPSKFYKQVANDFVNKLIDEGNSIESIGESLFSEDFLQEVGIKNNMPALVMLVAVVKDRVSKQSRDKGTTGARQVKLQKLDRRLAGYWQNLGTNSGRAQGIRSYITKSPEFNWMFIFDRANENLEKEGKLAATRVASDLPQTADNLQKTDAKAGEDAGEQVADDLEDNQDAIDLAAGEATLTDPEKSIYEQIKDDLRAIGFLQRLEQDEKKAASAKASLSNEDRNFLAKLTPEERKAEIAKRMKRVSENLRKLTGEESAAKTPEQKATRKKREKMVATAKKRAEQGKPIEAPSISKMELIEQMFVGFNDRDSIINEVGDALLKAAEQRKVKPKQKTAIQDLIAAIRQTLTANLKGEQIKADQPSLGKLLGKTFAQQGSEAALFAKSWEDGRKKVRAMLAEMGVDEASLDEELDTIMPPTPTLAYAPAAAKKAINVAIKEAGLTPQEALSNPAFFREAIMAKFNEAAEKDNLTEEGWNQSGKALAEKAVNEFIDNARIKAEKRSAESKAKMEKRKVEIADKRASQLIYSVEEQFRQGSKDLQTSKSGDSINKAFRDQVKDPVSKFDFFNRLAKLNVSHNVSERLFRTAAREKADLKAMEAFRRLEGPNAPQTMLREISALRPGEQAPLSKQIPWRKLLSQKASTVKIYRQRIFDTISSEESFADLDDAQKAKLADLLTKAWESKREAILDRMVKNVINQEQAAGRLTKEGADALRSQRQKLVEDINLGILDEDRLMKHLADKFGIKSEFTEAERANIDRLLDILQDDKLNEVKRNKAGYELLEALSSATKIPFAKLLADYWVSSVLSGLNTAASIAMAVANGGFELTVGLFRVLRAGFTNPKEVPAEIEASFKAMYEFLKAFGREGRLAWQYLVTGDRALLDPSLHNVRNDLNYDSIGKTVSLAERMAKSDKVLEKVMGIWMRSVSRLLTALDNFNTGVTKAGALPIVFRQLNLSGEDLQRATEKYNLKLYREKAIREDFDNKQPTNQHEKALVDSYAKARMMADLQEFGKFSENADFIAQNGAMTLDPTGVGGAIYSGIKYFTGGATTKADKFLADAQREWNQVDGDKTAKGLQLAFAYIRQFIAYNSANLAGLRFARFAGNKFNQGLSFIPGIGMFRMYEATVKDSKIEAKEAFTDMILRNQTAGLLFAIIGGMAIKAIMDEPDDEKRGFFWNGGWANLTPDQKQQKLASGQKEYTIGIPGVVAFNYQNWPMSSVFAAVGSLSDLARYSREQWNEKSVIGRLGSAAASGVFSAGEIPALSGFQTLFGNNLSSKDPNEKRLDRFAKVMAGWGGGFVPRILKDVDFMTDPGLRKYESLWEQTASHIPVYRRYSGEEYYDILGKQIERKVWPGSREFMELETDPEYRTLGKLNSRGIWLTPANAEHRMVGKGRFKRKLTQEEADAYSLETGKGYRQMLLRYGSRLEQMPTERARAFLMDKADEVRDRALQKITR